MCLLFISKNVWQSKHSIIKSSMTEKVLSKLCLLRLTTKACAVANLTHAYTSSKFVILHSTTPASKWNVNRKEILERFHHGILQIELFERHLNESKLAYGVWMVILIRKIVVWRDSELRFQYKSICDDGVISKKQYQIPSLSMS